MSLDREQPNDRETGVAASLAAARRTVAGVERELWALAAVALVGDLLLTYHGLEQGLREANPVARAAVDRYGYAALGALKAGAVGVAVAGRLAMPRRYGAVVPLALAAPWTAAVLLNAATILALH